MQQLDAKGLPLVHRTHADIQCRACGQSYRMPLGIVSEFRRSLGRVCWYHVAAPGIHHTCKRQSQ